MLRAWARSGWQYVGHNRMRGWGITDTRKILQTQNRYSYLTVTEDEYDMYSLPDSAPLQKNKFLIDAMRQLGGGEQKMLKDMQQEVRHGGGLDDVYKCIKSIDKPDPKGIFKHEPAVYAQKMGGTRGCLKHLSFREAHTRLNHNLSSKPGPTFEAMGFKDKGESLVVAVALAEQLYNEATKSSILGKCIPRYKLGGRTKKSTWDKFQDKADDLRQLGRVTWQGDHHESIIGNLFVYPITSWCHDVFTSGLIGFNKFSSDPTRLYHLISEYDTHINVDVKEFDLSVGTSKKRHFFEMLRFLFLRGDEREEESRLCNNLLDWLEDEITRVHVVLPTGKTYVTGVPIPSGTCFTSVFDTFINFAIWSDAMEEQQGKLFLGSSRVLALGDDGAVSYNSRLSYEINEVHAKNRKHRETRLLDRCAFYIDAHFDMRVDEPSKTHIAHKAVVGYTQPRVPEAILDGSRQRLARYRAYMRISGNDNVSDAYINLEREPIGAAPGRTHRWSYYCRDSFKFLKHYLKTERDEYDNITGYSCIRPMCEVVSNIMHPERCVNTIDDHIVRLQAAVVENFNNHHVVNHIMHYAYDAWLLKKHGFILKSDLRHAPYCKELVKRRAWYRRVERVVDLLIEDCEFAQWWATFIKVAEDLHIRIYRQGRIDWTMRDQLRSGRPTIKRTITAFFEYRELKSLDPIEIRDRRELLGSLGFYFLNNRDKALLVIQSMRRDWDNNIVHRARDSCRHARVLIDDTRLTLGLIDQLVQTV